MTELKNAYLMWHNNLMHVPRLSRYTLGMRIDNLFVDLIEVAFTAQYAKRDTKSVLLMQLSQRLDRVKYFITLLWEAKGLHPAQYGQLAQKLAIAGRMLGKWIQSTQQMKTPPT